MAANGDADFTDRGEGARRATDIGHAVVHPRQRQRVNVVQCHVLGPAAAGLQECRIQERPTVEGPVAQLLGHHHDVWLPCRLPTTPCVSTRRSMVLCIITYVVSMHVAYRGRKFATEPSSR